MKSRTRKCLLLAGILLTSVGTEFVLPAIAANNSKPTAKTAAVKAKSTSAASRNAASKKTPKTTKPSTKPKPIRLKIDVPCRAWTPKKVQPKAVLLCVHGLGLNSAAYEEFGNQMQKEGIGVFAVDVRGFGTWMKLEGKEKCDFKSCLSDVEQALRVLHIVYPEKPIFVLGESMGGAIAMRVTAEHQDLVDGLISCVPSGDRFHKTKNQLRVALHLLTLRANKEIDVGTNVIEDATEDEELRSKWKDDPLNRLKLSSKELMQFQHFMNENHETAKRIDSTPVLFVVGLNDKLVKPEGTIELYEEIAARDKKLATIKNAEHLVFEDHQISNELKGVLLNWLLSHKKKPLPPVQGAEAPAN